jgi:hypothetical protein
VRRYWLKDALVPRIGRAVRSLTVLLMAVLPGCADENPPLSLDEAVTCAGDRIKHQPGAFALIGNSIAYSYERENGAARVIVTFDERRRPINTFFERAPHGSHRDLMKAARAIKDCVAHGPQGQNDSESD